MDKTIQKLLGRSGLTLIRLRVLLEIADAGGIAKAVGKDPVRQSQYSRQLKELEEYFGVELTQRDGKSLVLTRIGQKLAEIIRQNFKILADFAAECANEPIVYHLGAGDCFIQWMILPRMGAFQKAFPDVTIRLCTLRTAQIIDKLHTLRIDFGIMRRDVMPAGFQSILIGNIESALFIPQQLLSKSSDKSDEWVMSSVPIAYMVSTGDFTRRLDEITCKSKLKINIRLECESFPEVCQAIQSGCYAGILPTMAATDLPRDKFVCRNPSFLKKLSGKIALVWNPRIMRLRSASAGIASWLGENLKK